MIANKCFYYQSMKGKSIQLILYLCDKIIDENSLKCSCHSGAIKGEANGQLPIEIFISNFLPTETSFSLNQCIYVFLLYHFL